MESEWTSRPTLKHWDKCRRTGNGCESAFSPRMRRMVLVPSLSFRSRSQLPRNIEIIIQGSYFSYFTDPYMSFYWDKTWFYLNNIPAVFNLVGRRATIGVC